MHDSRTVRFSESSEKEMPQESRRSPDPNPVRTDDAARKRRGCAPWDTKRMRALPTAAAHGPTNWPTDEFSSAQVRLGHNALMVKVAQRVKMDPM